MSDRWSEPEREFLQTGARTYLDVDAAMAQFRRMIQDECAALVSRRLDEISRVSGMDWTEEDLKDYAWRRLDCVHLGKQMALKDFGGLYVCLELNRAKRGMAYGALVYLYRHRATIAVDLWDRLDRAASDTAYCEGNSLIFERDVAEHQIPDLLEHLDRALDDCLTFIEGCGGLKKYVTEKA